MTEADKKLAVISANQTLATNNPRGLTDALRSAGYLNDGRFDIAGYESLNKALLELYLTNPDGWGSIMRSVPFNYQKTDSSTSPETKALFQNISIAIDPSISSERASSGRWYDNILGLILGSTTTTTVEPPPAQLPDKTSPWVYVGLITLGLAIVGLIIFAIKKV